jgi:hypothetical protein
MKKDGGGRGETEVQGTRIKEEMDGMGWEKKGDIIKRRGQWKG